MKPANFPGRRKLRVARGCYRAAGLALSPREYDRGAATNEALAESLLDQAEKHLGVQ